MKWSISPQDIAQGCALLGKGFNPESLAKATMHNLTKFGLNEVPEKKIRQHIALMLMKLGHSYLEDRVLFHTANPLSLARLASSNIPFFAGPVQIRLLPFAQFASMTHPADHWVNKDLLQLGCQDFEAITIWDRGQQSSAAQIVTFMTLMELSNKLAVTIDADVLNLQLPSQTGGAARPAAVFSFNSKLSYL